jgi:hypothetical protein
LRNFELLGEIRANVSKYRKRQSRAIFVAKPKLLIFQGAAHRNMVTVRCTLASFLPYFATNIEVRCTFQPFEI